MSEDDKVKDFPAPLMQGEMNTSAQTNQAADIAAAYAKSEEMAKQQGLGRGLKYHDTQMRAFASALEIPHSYGSVSRVHKNPVNDHLEVQTASGITINVPPGAQAVQAANLASLEHNRRLGVNSPYPPMPNSKVPYEPVQPTASAVTSALNDFEYFMLKRKAQEGTGLSPLELLTLCREDILRQQNANKGDAVPFQGEPFAVIVDVVSKSADNKIHMSSYGCNMDNAQEIAYRTLFIDGAKQRWRGQ